MKRFALLVTALFTLLSSSAHALVLHGATLQQYVWVTQMSTPLPDVEVSVTQSVRRCGSSAAIACALDNVEISPTGVRTDTYELLVNSETSRHDFFHEIGHFVDYAVLTDAQREEFKKLRHTSRDWSTGIDAPDEQFAEAYSQCNYVTSFKAYHYRPSLDQHRKICKLINSI